MSVLAIKERLFKQSIFKHYVAKKNVTIHLHIGDGGETSSYRTLIESNLFGDISISKLESVEYVHKQLGSRLRALLMRY